MNSRAGQQRGKLRDAEAGARCSKRIARGEDKHLRVELAPNERPQVKDGQVTSWMFAVDSHGSIATQDTWAGPSMSAGSLGLPSIGRLHPVDDRPPRNSDMPSHDIPPCPICDAAREHIFDMTLLGVHRVAYHQCRACGFLQTEKPWWLDEAYSRAIAVLDTGLVQRNFEMTNKLSRLLGTISEAHGRFVDLAGGTGLLTRMMRDRGFDFRWNDPHCENVHAPGFEVPDDGKSCEAVTAIEVLEHLHDPLTFIQQAIDRHQPKLLVFTTVLFAGDPPPPSWWYYLPNTGQHISFYQRGTLQRLAERCGLHFASHRQVHVLSRERISPLAFRFLLGKWGWLVDRSIRRRLPSLTRPDLATLEAGLVAKRQAKPGHA